MVQGLDLGGFSTDDAGLVLFAVTEKRTRCRPERSRSRSTRTVMVPVTDRNGNTRYVAQVIYEPVKYQHGNGMGFYYGGSDPSMLHYIEHVKCRNGYPSAITGAAQKLFAWLGPPSLSSTTTKSRWCSSTNRVWNW